MPVDLRLPPQGLFEGADYFEHGHGCSRSQVDNTKAVDAIEGAKKTPHVIDQAKCMLCGRCFQACPFDAVALLVAEKVG